MTKTEDVHVTLKVIFLFFVCHNSHQLFIRATCNFRTSAQTTYVEDEKNEYLFSYLCTQITLYYYNTYIHMFITYMMQTYNWCFLSITLASP